MRTARGVLRALAFGAIAIGLVAPVSAAHADPSLSDIQAQIQKSSADLEKIVEQYDKVTTDLKASQQQAVTLQQQLAPLQTRLDAAYANVGELAAEAYKNGNLSTASIMLDAGTTGSLLEQLSSLDEIAKSRQQDIQAYTTAKAAYDTQKKQLDTVLAQQTAQQQTLANQKKTIQAGLSKLYAMRQQAYGSATVSASSSYPSAPAVSGKAGVAVRYAYGALGAPYTWGGSGPYSAGYDCSGLTMASWSSAGVSLPHNAADQYYATSRISRSQLQPGDLVFYESLGHVAIYVGNGQVIHAPTFGERVQLASVDMMPPYGYGRVG